MSIRLEYNKSSTQRFITTLSEKMEGTICSGQTYYFIFENKQTDNLIEVELLDISSYPCRYNIFDVYTDINGTQSNTIKFTDQGWFNYEIYSNSGKTTLLEIGECYINNPSNPDHSYYDIDINKTTY
jgi:hypothetical protein